MGRFAIFWSVLVIFAAAMASSMVSMKVGERYDRVQDLKKQIRADTDAIRMLETELTYRASPQRLQALVDAHGLPLALPKANQYLVAVHDLAPQPGKEMPVVKTPLYAEAMPYVPPAAFARPKPPVQLAAIGGAGPVVAFAEPPLVTVPTPATSEKTLPTPPQAETAAAPVVTKAEMTKTPKVTPAAAKTLAENKAVAKPAEKKKAQKMATPDKPVAKPAMAAAPQAAAKEKTALAKAEKPAVPAAPRRLDSTLIASIESAAEKEAAQQ